MAGLREVSWRSITYARPSTTPQKDIKKHGHGELSKPRAPVVYVDLEGLVVACGVLAQAMRVKFQKHLIFCLIIDKFHFAGL